MKMKPDEAFGNVKVAISHLEAFNSILKNEKSVPQDVKELYNGALVALVNMGSTAECVINNCNRGMQLMLEKNEKVICNE